MTVLRRLSSLGRMNTLASCAGHLARELLQESLPRRWAHVQGVAARARGLAHVLGADADLLKAAAWLHDIGYAPSLATTGFHPLDGARYLRDAQHADVLVGEFEPPPDALASALTYCDMTTSPDGEPVPAERRLAEIHYRYGPRHLVSRSIQRATPMILRRRAGPEPGRRDRIAPQAREKSMPAELRSQRRAGGI